MTVILTSVSLAGMTTGPWTDEENELIVADYFAMLASDLISRPYNKAEHNRLLRTQIDRTGPSIEFKHRNISAVLKGSARAGLPATFPHSTSRCRSPMLSRAGCIGTPISRHSRRT